MRVKASYSSGVRRSSPADACSRVELAVSEPSMAALPARSGCARMRASWRSRRRGVHGGHERVVERVRGSSNGRSCHAISATHGECSNSAPKRSTNASWSSSLIAFHRMLDSTRVRRTAGATLRHMSALARRFRFTDRGTNTRTEALGGVATFLTMSYILFVNPAILSAAGMPFGAVAVATAIAAAVATAAMALATNLPFALAPGLGINAVVAFDIILGRGLAVAGRHGRHRHRGPDRGGPGARRTADGDHGGRPDVAEAGDRRRHRPLHHARRPARGRDRRQQPGHRHRPRRPHVRPGADHAGRHLRRGRAGRARDPRGGDPRRPRRDRARPDLRRARAGPTACSTRPAPTTSTRSAPRSIPTGSATR